MRFLIGLVCGAAVILLLAQAAGTAERIPWQRVPALFDALAVRVGDALDLPPRPPAADADRPPSDLPAQRSGRASVSGDAVAQIPRDEAAPQSTAEPPAVPDMAAAAAGSGAAQEPATRPIPRPPDPLPVDADAEDARPEDARPEDARRIAAELFETPAPAGVDNEQSVWVPFRSEMSASGFAERLTESLDHPFRVERRGPGRYEVVFGYTDELQRRALLTEAAAATGLPL